MNTPLYYSARVIHDPVAKEYNVYYKEKWYSREWNYDSCYRYEASLSGTPEFHRQRAIDRCNQIVSKSIVYTTKQDSYV